MYTVLFLDEVIGNVSKNSKCNRGVKTGKRISYFTVESELWSISGK